MAKKASAAQLAARAKFAAAAKARAVAAKGPKATAKKGSTKVKKAQMGNY